MFKQKDYQFFELAKKKMDEYVIEPGDELSLQVYSRDGFKLIDVLGGGVSGGAQTIQGATTAGNTTTTTSTTNTGNNTTTYIVDKEGFVKLPILGDFFAKGYSQYELSNLLSQRYSTLFVNPFVVLRVTNRRVFVFKGQTGMVIPLNETPTNILEVLAKSGGLDRTVKAYKIKVIRGDLKNPIVKMIDLSTLEGLRNSDLIVQTGDIIYVEQRKKFATDILTEISPILSGISVILTTTILIKTLGK
jgi:polysaccharide export outer membrane protein